MMADGQDRLPVVLMATLPALTWRFGIGFLQFQTRRKRGVRRFQQTLLASGMPREQAAGLAQAYHDAGSLRNILKGAVAAT